MITNFILSCSPLNAGNSNKRSDSIGLNTREVWPDKFLPYISYGVHYFVVHVLTNCRQLLLYISNDKTIRTSCRNYKGKVNGNIGSTLAFIRNPVNLK